MTTVADFLNEMRSLIGVVEQPSGSNYASPITPWYADLVNNQGFAKAPWCAMTITYALHKIGNTEFVYAYTPYIANDAKAGKDGMGWHSTPESGDLVLYSFGGSRIDHVGVVEAVRSDSTFVTIEGNIGNKCQRLVRDMKYVKGFARVPLTASQKLEPTPTPNEPIRPKPVSDLLRRGDRGQKVADWQKILVGAKLLGPNDIDGIFGPRTEAATKAFQRKLKVSADGIVGPQTRAATQKLLKYVASLPKSALSRPTIRRGSRGTHVTYLQQRLGGLVIDGIFGPNTEAKVKAYQRSKGLGVDGIVGPDTWGSIG